MSNGKKVVVFDVAEIEELDDDVVRAPRMRSASTTARAAVRAIDVELDQLSENLVGFIDNVRGMLAKVGDYAGGFAVEEVEIQAQINGEGKVGFLGNGVKASGGASLKIVLKRRENEKP